MNLSFNINFTNEEIILVTHMMMSFIKPYINISPFHTILLDFISYMFNQINVAGLIKRRGLWKMVKIGLQIKAQLENVTNLLATGADFRWFLKTKCASCGEVSAELQYITLGESVPLKV